MNSWQTTIAGIVAIMAAVVLLTIHPTAENTVLGVGLISTGSGLIQAADHSKVSPPSEPPKQQ